MLLKEAPDRELSFPLHHAVWWKTGGWGLILTHCCPQFRRLKRIQTTQSWFWDFRADKTFTTLVRRSSHSASDSTTRPQAWPSRQRRVTDGPGWFQVRAASHYFQDYQRRPGEVRPWPCPDSWRSCSCRVTALPATSAAWLELSVPLATTVAAAASCISNLGTQNSGWRFSAALLPRLFWTNPRSHHKGATGRVRTGDQLLPVLCHCQLGQDIPTVCRQDLLLPINWYYQILCIIIMIMDMKIMMQ